ncbi:Uncharacterised protein [Mycoplasmopsis caviae]|uniref:Uncharacterized protein n=1 Tax=Mycoplasmopsis caviae TaxID=55603 RepID=A0A3P8MF93_9BACT|nr:Uncharacterised protein [Mycoplasmopsis caviae]
MKDKKHLIETLITELILYVFMFLLMLYCLIYNFTRLVVSIRIILMPTELYNSLFFVLSIIIIFALFFKRCWSQNYYSIKSFVLAVEIIHLLSLFLFITSNIIKILWISDVNWEVFIIPWIILNLILILSNILICSHLIIKVKKINSLIHAVYGITKS